MEGRYDPQSVEELFKDYKGRRAGLIKALTTDVDIFYMQCDPDKENLCLYGFPSGQWEVNLPAEEVPPELPEPALGINFARDGMHETDWVCLVAVHSDAWLIAVSFYFCSRFGYDKAARKRLFNMINELPTIYEVVTGTANSINESKSNSNPKPATKQQQPSHKTHPKEEEEEDYEEEAAAEEIEEGYEEDEHGETLCGACGQNYASDEFWICCDVCEKWFHGQCVKITPAKAEHMKQYKCPSCSTIKRPRHGRP